MHKSQYEELENQINKVIKTAPAIEYVCEYDPKGYSDVKAFFLNGMCYNNKPTKIFGYIGFPDELKEEKSPAVVLVHGGDGYAYPEWIKKWTKKGYIAIACCNTGYLPINGKITDFISADSWTKSSGSNEWVLGPDNDNMGYSNESIYKQWMYHAVCGTILSNNFLRTLNQVDDKKIGLVGISWGAVISSIVIGYDNRFAFAIPVYGCACLNKSLGWIGGFFKNAETLSLWEAGERLECVDFPVLWVCWANDPCFSIQSNSFSFDKTRKSLITIKNQWGHSHIEGWTPIEIYAFADSVVKNGNPMTEFTSQPQAIKGKKASFEVKYSKNATSIEAKIYYLTEKMTYSVKKATEDRKELSIDQNWKEAKCDFNENMVSFVVPIDAKAYYIELTTVINNVSYCTTSKYIEC